MRRFLLLLFVCWPLLVAAQPSGADIEKAKKLVAAADNLFQLQKYDQALAHYQEAYDLSKAPAILFNVGQCYRLTNHPQEAIQSYRAFLEAIPNTPYRKEVEEKIALLEEEVKKLPPKSQPASTSLPTSMAATTQAVIAPEAPLWKQYALQYKLTGGLAGGALVLGTVAVLVTRDSRQEGNITEAREKNFDLALVLACDALWLASATTATLTYLKKENNSKAMGRSR